MDEPTSDYEELEVIPIENEVIKKDLETKKDDDSDTDDEDNTLAAIAKNAKARKVKEEASKLGAKPLTDLFNCSPAAREVTSSPGGRVPPITPTKDLDERTKKALESRRLAEEKRLEEKKQREEEKRKREEEKLQKQLDLEKLKLEREETRRLANEKKAEEKRLKDEEKKKKEEERLQKLQELEKQKQEREEAKKYWEERKWEEKRKKDELEDEKKKAREEERKKREQEREQKLKDIEKAKMEKDEARKQAEEEKRKAEDEKKKVEEEKKRAEEKEIQKREKQKQFFGSFFKSPASISSRKSNNGGALAGSEGVSGESKLGGEPNDVIELLPNGQPRPVSDENAKKARNYIGPFVKFEPLPGMTLMPHKQRNPMDIAAFEEAVEKQEVKLSLKDYFDRSKKKVTNRSLRRQIEKDVSDKEEVSAIVPDLKIRMKKDGSFVGYLKEVLTVATEDEPPNPTSGPDLKSDDVITVDPDDVNQATVEVTSEKKSAAHDSVDLTIVDDSIVELEPEQSKSANDADVTKKDKDVKNEVLEKYEIKKLFFQDVKELDVFLLQATNSGARKFVTKCRYIRIRHNSEDKSWLDYFGTWRKQTDDIKLPRRPITKLLKFFDYNEEDDFYSDVEEAGESVDESGDDVGSHSEDEYDYEDEDGFLVPHGYLSEEEGGEGDNADTEELKRQTKEWEARFKKKCVKLVPRLVGPFYGDDKPAELLQFSAVFLCDTSQPIQVFSTDDEQSRAQKDKTMRKKTEDGENVLTVIPKAAMPNLIRLVHGNTKGIKVLVEEFRAFWMKETQTLENPQGDNLSKKKLEIRMLSIADKEKREKEYNKVCWYVSKDVLRQYRLTKLPVPNPSCVNKENEKDSDVTSKRSSSASVSTEQTVEPPNKKAKIATS